MKILHSITTELNTQEFNKLSDKIIDSLYALNPTIQSLYDIHINFIDDSWRIDFIPQNNNTPVIKVDTRIEYDSNNQEILRINPKSLADFPKTLKFRDEDSSYDLCMNYIEIFDFILNLYDFEYRLS